MYSRKLDFLWVWGFFFKIRQVVMYLSGLPCWREERVAGLVPGSFASLFSVLLYRFIFWLHCIFVAVLRLSL